MKNIKRAKIYEALTAVANNSVIMFDNKAEVFSSNKSKKYIVEWNANEYSSNDNATYWQGYPGYPIIAVLLVNNIIEYNKDILIYFKDIEWKKINTKFKNDYLKSIEFFYQDIDGNKKELIEKEINKIYEELENIDLVIKRSRYYPPK